MVLVFLVTALLTLTGCETVNGYLYSEYRKKSDVQKEISELEAKHRSDVDIKVKEVQVKLEKTIQSQDDQMQAGANKLYIANEAFKFYKQPTRLDSIINNRVTEAQVALKKLPTEQALKEENQRLKEELDETKVSKEDLIERHNRALAENAKLSAETERAKQEVAAAKDNLFTTEQKYIRDSGVLQTKLKDVNDQIEQKQKEAANNKDSVERMKTKLMVGCGIAAALCILGTLYSPVGKGSLAIGSAIFGGAAAAIPFIEGWMILVAVLVVAAIITIVFLYKHHIADKTSDNLINHIQDIKENPDISDEVKQIIKKSLTEWNGKYVGNNVTQTDNAVEKYIKSKLKDYGRL